jgi:hypothetical protein
MLGRHPVIQKDAEQDRREQNGHLLMQRPYPEALRGRRKGRERRNKRVRGLQNCSPVSFHQGMQDTTPLHFALSSQWIRGFSGAQCGVRTTNIRAILRQWGQDGERELACMGTGSKEKWSPHNLGCCWGGGEQSGLCILKKTQSLVLIEMQTNLLETLPVFF